MKISLQLTDDRQWDVSRTARYGPLWPLQTQRLTGQKRRNKLCSGDGISARKWIKWGYTEMEPVVSWWQHCYLSSNQVRVHWKGASGQLVRASLPVNESREGTQKLLHCDLWHHRSKMGAEGMGARPQQTQSHHWVRGLMGPASARQGKKAEWGDVSQRPRLVAADCRGAHMEGRREGWREGGTERQTERGKDGWTDGGRDRGRDWEREGWREGGRERQTERGKDGWTDGGRDRGRDWEREGWREGGRERQTERGKDGWTDGGRDRGRDWEREGWREGGRERQTERGKDGWTDGGRDRGRDWEREGWREGGRERQTERGKDGWTDGGRDRGRDWEREGWREGGRERQTERGKDGWTDGGRDRGRDWEREGWREGGRGKGGRHGGRGGGMAVTVSTGIQLKVQASYGYFITISATEVYIFFALNLTPQGQAMPVPQRRARKKDWYMLQ